MPTYIFTTSVEPVNNLNGSSWRIAVTPEIDRAAFAGVFWVSWVSADEASLMLTIGVVDAFVTSDLAAVSSLTREFRGADGKDARLFRSAVDDDGGLSRTTVLNVRTIDGTAARDILRGGETIDDIFGRAGHDRIYGGDGSDLIFGGGGGDRIEGGLGQDEIYGGSGKDRFLGGISSDRLFGDQGEDRINGGRDNDYIEGGAGNDALFGGQNADEIYGGGGNDRIEGGTVNSYHERLFGGGGNDHLSGSAGGINGRMDGGAGRDLLEGGGNMFGGGGADRLIGSGRLFGDGGQDRLTMTGRGEMTGGEDVDRFILVYKADAPRDLYVSGGGEINDFDTVTETIDMRRTVFESLDELTIFQGSSSTSYSYNSYEEGVYFRLVVDHAPGATLGEDNFIF